MKKIGFILLILTILISSSCAFFNKKDSYFPYEIGIRIFTNNWYSEQLSALKEPVIYILADKSKIIYRFTCLRTFHNPFSIRIEIDNQKESAILFFKMCDGAGGYDLGDLSINEEKILTRSEIESIIETVEKYDYLGMDFEDDIKGLDGSEWIIEMLSDGKYHAISRWTPNDGAVYELGNLFIQLSGQEIEKLY